LSVVSTHLPDYECQLSGYESEASVFRFGTVSGEGLGLIKARFQPDPARQPHRPAIFKNERQEWSAANLGCAAIAVTLTLKLLAR
jgi:hypothetical protein